MQALTSLTAGSMFVVLDIICVKTVARNMCHVVKNIGNGKSIWSSTALLNKICIVEGIATVRRHTTFIAVAPNIQQLIALCHVAAVGAVELVSTDIAQALSIAENTQDTNYLCSTV